MSTALSYTAQVSKTYQHIQKGFGEIFWERVVYDPIQDYYLEKGLETAVKFGHQAGEITSGYDGLHGLMHQIPLPKALAQYSHGIKLFTLVIGFNIHPLDKQYLNQHTFYTPGVDFILHQGLNAFSTAAFIMAYPALNSSYATNIPSEIKYTVTETIKFFGVNPLEIMHAAKSILGENSIMGRGIEYLSYGEDYTKTRAEDEEYKQIMDAYSNFMEFTDSLMHAYVELSLINNNKHLSEMPMLHIYLQARLYLYENTNAEEEAINKEIALLKAPHNNKTCTNSSHNHIISEESSTWGDWLYENKDYIYNAAKTVHGLYTICKMIAPIVKILYPYAAGHRTAIEDFKGSIVSLAQFKPDLKEIIKISAKALEASLGNYKAPDIAADLFKALDANLFNYNLADDKAPDVALGSYKAPDSDYEFSFEDESEELSTAIQTPAEEGPEDSRTLTESPSLSRTLKGGIIDPSNKVTENWDEGSNTDGETTITSDSAASIYCGSYADIQYALLGDNNQECSFPWCFKHV
jgi:hypothetical protein